MKVVVTDTGIELQESEIFRALSTESHVPDLRATELEPWGKFDGEHMWLSIQQLETELAALLNDAHWRNNFTQMLSYAQQNGWISSAGTHVRAHIDYV